MKILEFQWETRKTWKKKHSIAESWKSKNHIIPLDNHENYENHRIPIDNHEN